MKATMENSMANEKKTGGLPFAIRQGFGFCMFCVLAIGAAYCQGKQSQADRVADAVEKVKQGHFDGTDVDHIVRSGAIQAIPSLKEQFAQKHDNQTKGILASALVTLGDKEPVYWDFLVEQATEAIESDAPFPREFDAQGKMLRDHFSPAFLQWAKNHGLSPGDAGQVVGYELPGKLILLAHTGDPRGVGLLRQALSSRNYVLAVIASKGLAQLRDKESIPMIIEAAQKAPSDVSPGIADALLYFDDPHAQDAAAKFIPDGDYRQEIRKNIREGKATPF
jgi:hypothetical protein